jgi:hypothetical protein
LTTATPAPGVREAVRAPRIIASIAALSVVVVPLDLPLETSGLIPDPTWKAQFAKDHPEVLLPDEQSWLPGDDIQMAIGQGYLLVSPLQQAVAYSAIENGGTVVTPHLVQSVTGPDDFASMAEAVGTELGRIAVLRRIGKEGLGAENDCAHQMRRLQRQGADHLSSEGGDLRKA